jgi:hypothetical protein
VHDDVRLRRHHQEVHRRAPFVDGHRLTHAFVRTNAEREWLRASVGAAVFGAHLTLLQGPSPTSVWPRRKQIQHLLWSLQQQEIILGKLLFKKGVRKLYGSGRTVVPRGAMAGRGAMGESVGSNVPEAGTEPEQQPHTQPAQEQVLDLFPPRPDSSGARAPEKPQQGFSSEPAAGV